MPDVITETDLENAKVDANALSAIVNGGPTDPDVVTRLGVVVKPIAKVIAAQVLQEETATAQAAIATEKAAEAAASAASVSAFEANFGAAALPGYAFNIVDGSKKVTLGVRDDGIAVTKRFITSQLIAGSSEHIPSLPGFSWYLEDRNGKAPFGAKDDGTFAAGSIECNQLKIGGMVISRIGEASSSTRPAYYPANVAHIFSYGQSLSIGVQSNPPISTVTRFDGIMFNSVRAWDAGGTGTGYDAFNPIAETFNATETAGETPCSGGAEMIKELILSENGVAYTQQSFQILSSAPGFGATTINDLSGPGGYYARALDDVTHGAALAAAAGKTFKSLAFYWLQGESDIGNTDYHTKLVALRASFTTDIRAITGQTEEVLCIAYEGTRQDTCLEFLKAAALDPHIHIALAMYPIPRVGDGVHMPALSSKHVGAYLGRAAKRAIVDGAPYKPLLPASTFRNGKIVEIRYDVPHGPLVWDTTNYAAQTDMGYGLFQPDGVTPIAISSVDITQPDTVRIVAAVAIPAGAILRYGLTDPTSHTATFGGNLRDSDPTVFDGGGLNLPLPSWALCCEEII